MYGFVLCKSYMKYTRMQKKSKIVKNVNVPYFNETSVMLSFPSLADCSAAIWHLLVFIFF